MSLDRAADDAVFHAVGRAPSRLDRQAERAAKPQHNEAEVALTVADLSGKHVGQRITLETDDLRLTGMLTDVEHRATELFYSGLQPAPVRARGLQHTLTIGSWSGTVAGTAAVELVTPCPFAAALFAVEAEARRLYAGKNEHDLRLVMSILKTVRAEGTVDSSSARE